VFKKPGFIQGAMQPVSATRCSNQYHRVPMATRPWCWKRAEYL